MRRSSTGFLACVFLLAYATISLRGAGTVAWEMNTYQDFLRGRFQGVSLSRDGRLTLAPKMDTVFDSDQPIIWSIAEAADGAIYVATGHRGQVFRVERSGKSSLLWTADEPEVFALAVDRKGTLFAATSPDGKVYRILNGKASEYFAPGAKYIWSLAIAADDALYVGTGDRGKIFRVEADGKGEVFYETGQSHVTSLSLDGQSRLLAGTEPNGMLYRISAKDKAFVLYDASLPEIRGIVSAPDGTIYAAALGGSVAKRTQAPGLAGQGSSGNTAITAPATTITITADAQSGAEIKPPAAEISKQAQPAAPAQTPAQVTTPVADLTGVEKSALYKINPDNTVETLWSSKEENVYDLLALPDQILFSTDGNGRIYRLSSDRKVTLVVQTNESEATRLLSIKGSVLAATGNMGRIYRLGDGPGAAGSYEAPVHDAGTAAKWGRLSWRASINPGGNLVFRTRSGNSARPDKTWSDWSEQLVDQTGSRIESPNARYIQWKAEFRNAGGGTPVLDSVSVAYLPQNTAPVLRSISVTAQLATAAAKVPAQGAAAAYSVTVTDTADVGTSSPGTPTQTLSRAASQHINISWQAEDTDGDRLVYTLSFRGEDEREWKLLRSNLHENTFTLDGDALADGKYFFRVITSDRESNPASAARETEMISAPVLIDNTPPVVTVSAPRRAAGAIEVDIEAVDAASPLRRCEYSLDAGSWTPIQSADGVTDSLREKFALRLDHLSPGEHLIVIRAVDSANNAGLAKLVLAGN